MFNKLFENIEPNSVDLSGFAVQTDLNDKLWHNEKLDKNARLMLLEISLEFLEDAEIDEFVDITMTGSLANYNWNETYSDIDLHIIVDSSSISDDPEIAKSYFNEKRFNWNTLHDKLKIYNYPVEIYVQDINEPHTSTGVYSLIKNDWIIKPDIKNLKDTSNKSHIKYGVSTLDTNNDKQTAERLLNIANSLFDSIKNERKESLSSTKYGELTTGNILFKYLRRNGYLEKLSKFKRKCFDIIHSL